MLPEEALPNHLAWWGLRRFTSEREYFRWQRETLSPAHLDELNRLAEQKRATESDADELAFYDLSSRSPILPVLYSQRYDYYVTLGTAVADRLGGALSVLDFGCGPGILTTFLAGQFPLCSFVGIDRSRTCVDVATRKALELGLTNIRFECLDITHSSVPGHYDLIIATQALLQKEGDPGITSRSWHTFERDHDPAAQAAFEQRTGLSVRLGRLLGGLVPRGRLILFEKTGHLARRIPFQRALEKRGLRLLEAPPFLHYRSIEEPEEDDPLYVLGQRDTDQGPIPDLQWSDVPTIAPEKGWYRCRGTSARVVLEALPGRVVTASTGWNTHEDDGMVRVEWGRAAESLIYVVISSKSGFDGIIVGGLPTSPSLESRYHAITALDFRDSLKVQAFLDETWPQSDDQEDPLLTPIYENHTWAAQEVWSSLPDRRTLKEITNQEPDGRQVHIELGHAKELVYLYCANTYDQRQLVLVDQPRRHILETYFQELSEGQAHHTSQRQP